MNVEAKDSVPEDERKRPKFSRRELFSQLLSKRQNEEEGQGQVETKGWDENVTVEVLKNSGLAGLAELKSAVEKELMPDAKELNRREFLKLATFGIAYAAFTPTFHKVESIDKFLEKEGSYKPGFIEAGIQTEFITEEGHLKWLRESLKVPVVKQTVIDVFKHVAEVNEGEQVAWGDLMSSTVASAKGNLQQMFPEIEESQLDIEAFHLASIALGQSLSKTWHEQDLLEIRDAAGINVQDLEPKAFFGRKGFYRRFPKIFATALSAEELAHTDKETGQDRSSHVATHLALVAEYVYSARNDIGTHREVPRAIAARLELADDEFQRAEVLSNITGDAYEIETTFAKSGGLGINKEPTSGVFSSDYDEDIKANQLGRNIGIWVMRQMYEEGKSWDEIKPLIETLNDPRWEDQETPPDFP